MSMRIEKATLGDLAEVSALYDDVADALEHSPINWAGWRKGVYPTHIDAEAALPEGTLYILRDEQGAIAATAILNHEQPEPYLALPWPIAATGERVAVVHTFMTRPNSLRRGFGAQMLSQLHELARKQGCCCVRLDTYQHNAPAKALYEKLGYRRVGLVDLGFGAYGLDWYQCYELPL